MYEHNALGYWSGLALCLTKVRSSRARCPATALILYLLVWPINKTLFGQSMKKIKFDKLNKYLIQKTRIQVLSRLQQAIKEEN